MIDGWRRDPKEPAVEEGIDIKITQRSCMEEEIVCYRWNGLIDELLNDQTLLQLITKDL